MTRAIRPPAIASLFLALGCSGDRPTEEAADGTEAASESGTGDGDGESGDGDGESGDGDGDGEPGDGDGDGDGDGLVVPFDPSTLIIPMDTDYQDMGMLEAYGLVYQLLLADVPIHWAIAPDKQLGGVDFTTSSIDVRTGMDVVDHGYRGGPFLISADDFALAMPVVEAWIEANPDTTVHMASVEFEAFISRLLLNAPTIAIFADGNEDIARGYLLAAKIPDSTGDLDWPDDSPDLLDVAEVAGPSDQDHKDGALFGGFEAPIYCQFMSMHWDVNQAQQNPEVVAEVHSYLEFSTHFFAECQAVNAFENHPEHGRFLTPNGLEIAAKPDAWDFYRMDTPFGQLDGPFESVGGSEPAYTVPAGDSYLQTDTTIITEAGTPESVGDVWMTGYRGGQCPASAKECPGAGKVSYLGGHAYTTTLPISANPQTAGVRLFLNSLFEAPCAFDR